MAREKRLIDAQPIVQFIMDGLNNPDKMKALGHDAIEILAEIEFATTVDPVHAAGACYCGECKHWQKAHSSLIGEVMCCTGQGSVRIQKAADDFCSSGERRKDA